MTLRVTHTIGKITVSAVYIRREADQTKSIAGRTDVSIPEDVPRVLAAQIAFDRFNHGSPFEIPFEGRSMSVGDLVLVSYDLNASLYMCQPNGWQAVPMTLLLP
jgi:hypothetical protein